MYTCMYKNEHPFQQTSRHIIYAFIRGKVNGYPNVHFLSQHNTSHDNVGVDRNQNSVGSIANINADDINADSHTCGW